MYVHAVLGLRDPPTYVHTKVPGWHDPVHNWQLCTHARGTQPLTAALKHITTQHKEVCALYGPGRPFVVVNSLPSCN